MDEKHAPSRSTAEAIVEFSKAETAVDSAGLWLVFATGSPAKIWTTAHMRLVGYEPPPGTHPGDLFQANGFIAVRLRQEVA